MVICYYLNLFENELFQKNSGRTIIVPNSLDQDLARLSVGPDLCANSLQSFLADNLPVKS